MLKRMLFTRLELASRQKINYKRDFLSSYTAINHVSIKADPKKTKK